MGVFSEIARELWALVYGDGVADDGRIADLSSCLNVIAENSGNWVEHGEPLETGQTTLYARRCIEAALNKYLSVVLPKLETIASAYLMVEDAEVEKWDHITRARQFPRVDLNTAGQRTLESLPGIGSHTAALLIDSRRALGGFARWEQVDAVRGIGDQTMRHIMDFCFLSDPNSSRLLFETDAKNPFVRFARLVKTTRFEEFTLRPVYSQEGSVDSELIDELKRVEDLVKRDPHPFVNRYYPRRKVDTLVDVPDAELLFPCGSVVPLSSRNYLDFVIEAIDRSSISINILMFLMSFDEAGEHPNQRIIDALIRSKERGAEVKVLLDRDRQSDPYNSTVINSPILATLNAEGIEARLDSSDRLLHSKVIILDGEMVIMGSHNLTAGSYFRYVDYSVATISREIADSLSQEFETLWSANG